MQVSQALEAVLTSLPDDLPPEMQELFGPGILTGGDVLPPHLFYEAVEQMSVAISITDTDANILYVNAAFTALTEFADYEIIGQNMSRLSSKATDVSVYEKLWATIQAGEIWNGRLVNRKHDNGRYLADLTIVPVKTSTGVIRYYLGMHRDVTEICHLQRQVEDQKNLIEMIIDNAPVVIALIGLDGKVIIDNHAYKCLAGEMRGREPADFFLEALAGVLGGGLAAACEKQTPISGLEVRFDPGGEKPVRWFSCSGQWVDEFELATNTYFDTNRHKALLLVCNEITGLKRQFDVARLNAVRARMAEEEMGQITDEIIFGALCQLQGPINVIKAMAAMQRRQGGGTTPMSAALDAVLASGSKAIETLQLSRPVRPGEVRMPVNINEVIRDVLILSADRLSANGVIVDWHPQSELPSVLGSMRALRILLKNILSNAIIAIGEPGAVVREVSIRTAVGPDGMMEICVHDSGPGIKRAIQSKIFEPFFSGWKKHPNSIGMGLSIARQIISELGGEIYIAHTTRHGCAMCFSIPVCGADESISR